MTFPESGALALATILVVLPLLTTPFDRRFLRSRPGTAAKLAYYAITIAVSWALTAAAVWLLGIDRLASAPWPLATWLIAPTITAPAIGILLAAFVVMGLMPLIQSLRGTRWRRAYANAYRRHAEKFPGLLPDSAAERFGFVLLSLTAGICEEILYRGFLIRYLHEGAPALPVLAALVVSSLAFGLGHFYQGVTGVARTGLVGAALALLFLVSGSLIPGIILHALIDLQGAYVLRPFPDDDMAPAAA